MKRQAENDVLDGRSVGDLLCEGFQEFAEELKKNKGAVPKKFTCHKISLDLHETKYRPGMVQEARKLLGASQVVFARFLGVSPRTVRAWEQGENTPSQVAARLLDEIRRDPSYWRARLRQLAVSKTPKAKK